MTDYSIESLCSTFSEHADKVDAENIDFIKRFKANNPDQPLPEHVSCDFNIARALSVISKEICELKNK